MTAVLSWLAFGFLAGLVARALGRGHPRLGCIPTIAVGMVGALIGGLIGDEVLGREGERFQWDLVPFLLAVLGAIVLLLALSALRGRSRF